MPVWRDCLLDTDTPVSAFAKLRRGPFAFLLESAPAGGETWARYTFLGTEPRAAWRLRDDVVEDWTPERGWHGTRRPADPLADLRALIVRARTRRCARARRVLGRRGRLLQLRCGAADRASAVTRRKRAIDAPDALFVFTRALVIIDNLRAQARVVVGVPVPAGTDRRGAAPQLRCGGGARRWTRDDRAAAHAGRRSRRSTWIASAAARERDVEHRRARIPSGRGADQASTSWPATASRRCSRGASRVPLDFDPTQLYRALRALNPSPVHVPPGARRPRAGGQLARAAGARGGRTRDGAADRRHAAARRDGADEDAALGGAARATRRSAPST